jgi:hypothetical protein
MKQLFNFLLLFVLLAAGLQIMSCKKDKKPEVISGFSFKVDAVDFKKGNCSGIKSGINIQENITLVLL